MSLWELTHFERVPVEAPKGKDNTIFQLQEEVSWSRDLLDASAFNNKNALECTSGGLQMQHFHGIYSLSPFGWLSYKLGCLWQKCLLQRIILDITWTMFISGLRKRRSEQYSLKWQHCSFQFPLLKVLLLVKLNLYFFFFCPCHSPHFRLLIPAHMRCICPLFPVNIDSPVFGSLFPRPCH